MLSYFDTHAHLDDESFKRMWPAVMARAAEAGVTNIVCVGTSARTSRRCVEIAEKYPSISAAVGIQPNYVSEATPHDWEQIVEMAGHPRVVAIGETGLDRYWDRAPFDLQQAYFDRHLRLAQETGLPFIVHMRDCGADVLELLREAAARGPLRGVMHSFTGDADTALACLELGLHVSFAGMVTYKKSDALRAVARLVPADRLLIETDSPYLPPHPVRSQRPNEPALIVHTAACLAEARGTPLPELVQQTTENARRLFRREPL